MSDIIATEKCRECGGTMEGRKGEYRYRECGLNSVTLQDILVFHCTKCNDLVPEIPAAGVLHRVIALKLLVKKSLLAGAEIRFLRKLIGYSMDEFCEVTGVNKSVAYRWENRGSHSDKFDRTLRLLVLTRLLTELAGQPKPVLRHVTIRELSERVENALKVIENKDSEGEESYMISPSDLEQYGYGDKSADSSQKLPTVN